MRESKTRSRTPKACHHQGEDPTPAWAMRNVRSPERAARSLTANREGGPSLLE